ncbi:MAG: hypothetical protein JXQ76_03810 [Campylobacterales bacterium]|nr:hypothetical protein [Campylobacterales bacterium]
MLPIVIIILSFSFGVARGAYIKENIHVKINQKDTVYVLFMTTSSGVGLFDYEKKYSEFVSWDNVKKLTFLKEKKYSLEKLF